MSDNVELEEQLNTDENVDAVSSEVSSDIGAIDNASINAVDNDSTSNNVAIEADAINNDSTSDDVADSTSGDTQDNMASETDIMDDTTSDDTIDSESSDIDTVEQVSEEHINMDSKSADKPMFYIEPKKSDCNRSDATLLLAKKVGFYGLVSFLILSIISTAITKLWANSLNLLFMGLAVLMYGVQHMLQIKAIGACNCSSCRIQKHKSKLIVTACVVGFVVLFVLFCVKQFVGF